MAEIAFKPEEITNKIEYCVDVILKEAKKRFCLTKPRPKNQVKDIQAKDCCF